MKKRDLALLSLLYLFIALMAIGFAVVINGDCPLSHTKGDYEACIASANKRRNAGSIVAVIGYPIVVAWYARKRRRGG